MPGAINIPRSYRQVLAKLCRENPVIATDVLTADNTTRQYLFAVVSGYLLKRTRCSKTWLLDNILVTDRKEVLNQVWGSEFKNWKTILGKLQPGIYTPVFYARLVDASANPRLAKKLRHWPYCITPEVVDMLADDDLGILKPRIIKMLLHRDRRIEMQDMISAVRKRLPRLSGTAISSLSRCQQLEDINSWFEKWMGKVPFPAPPWEGDNYLVPLTSTRQLREISKRFRNCLGNQFDEVLSGRRYFYCDRNMQEVAIEVERGDYSIWTITDILGPQNKDVKREIYKDCEQRLKSAGFIQSRRLGWLH